MCQHVTKRMHKRWTNDGRGMGLILRRSVLGCGESYFDCWPPGLPVGCPGCAVVFFLGLPFGQPPFLAFRRAAAALARLVARPACAASTLPMSAPHLGHFNVLIRASLSPMPLRSSRSPSEADVRGGHESEWIG